MVGVDLGPRRDDENGIERPVSIAIRARHVDHPLRFSETATARGYVHQCTDADALDRRFDDGTVTAYVGYDCTADSLHVGSLVSIMLLRLLQKCGHRPIVLMGGGTTRIGDPSGKDEARQLLSDAEIARNMAGIRAVFARFLDFGERPSRKRGPPVRSWSTMPIGSTASIICRSCAMSGGISRSTGC